MAQKQTGSERGPAQRSEENELGGTFLETPKEPLAGSVPQDTPTFDSLAEQNLVNRNLVETITQDLKLDYMMPVQAATLQELLPPARRDCLVQANTGTGRTIAFLLPAIQTLISKNRSTGTGISLLVISPTRELAMQIAQEADGLLQRMRTYKVCLAIGGTNKNTEKAKILAGSDILVATPGRLLDHMSSSAIRDTFSHLDTLVLDEADRLLDMGFLRALTDIVACLPNKEETDRQGMVFSATITRQVQKIADLVLSPGYKCSLSIPVAELNTPERIRQHIITVPTFASVASAMVGAVREEVTLVGAESIKAIIFAPTAAHANFYGGILSALTDMAKVQVRVLHARFSQSRRKNTTREFRSAKTGILVATDIVARGMDFPGVTSVLQVGIPPDKKVYIHRLGRTGRAGAEGRGILIVTEAEMFFPQSVLKAIPFVPSTADFSLAPQVESIVEQMEDKQKAKIYQAWLGYYKGHMKHFMWDNEELVAQAIVFARHGLRFPGTPPIERSVVSKMRLRGVKGLVVVPDAQNRHHRGKNGGALGRTAGRDGRSYEPSH